MCNLTQLVHTNRVLCSVRHRFKYDNTINNMEEMNLLQVMWFGVLRAVLLKIHVFWDVMLSC